LDTLAIHFAIQECQAGSSTSEIYTDVLGGKRIAAIHGHNTHLLQTIIENGHFDYVFHGHTHRRRDDEIGGTRVINPGAIGGAFRSSRSFCILNLENNDLNYYPVG
jgi:predicted phosphodiesterase